jgi:hypothetical protein
MPNNTIFLALSLDADRQEEIEAGYIKGSESHHTGYCALTLLICTPVGYPGVTKLLTHSLKFSLKNCEFDFRLPFGSFRIIFLSCSDHLVNYVSKWKLYVLLTVHLDGTCYTFR